MMQSTIKLFLQEGFNVNIVRVEDDVKLLYRVDIYKDNERSGAFLFDPITFEMLSGREADQTENKETIREYYMKEFPTDELGEEIDHKATFNGLYRALLNSEDPYDYINVHDSVVRERVFEKLAEIRGVDYDTIYNMWNS